MKTRFLVALAAAATAALMAVGSAGAATFSNSGAITINDASAAANCSFGEPSPGPGAATPYPSQITVSGLTGTVTDVNVTVTGLSHSFPDDVGMLLVGPAGQSTILMADTGLNGGLSGVNLTFDDAAAASLPDDGQIVSGTYKPTLGTATAPFESCSVPTSFPSPAPASPYGSTLSVFNGTDPNGTWSLYVIDDSSLDAGSISGGWSLDITAGATAQQQIADLQATVAGLGLPHGLTTALNAKLQDALTDLNADDTAGACDSLQAFLNQVKAQTGKKLTTAQAQQLTDAANAIRTQLDC
jgi:subtilisin-like proprotein convertase family protein